MFNTTVSNNPKSSATHSARVGRAKGKLYSGVKYALPTFGAIIAAIFRESIINNVKNVPPTAYGFTILGIGIAGVLYFLIPLATDIEEIHTEINSIKKDVRLTQKEIKSISLSDSEDSDGDSTSTGEDVRGDGGRIPRPNPTSRTVTLAFAFAGAIAGASIGFIGGIPAALAVSLLGMAIGIEVARRYSMKKQVQASSTVGVKAEVQTIRKPTSFQVALLDTAGDVHVVNNERDTLNMLDSTFQTAYIPIRYSSESEAEIISIDLRSTISEQRSMGEEILVYGTVRLTNPETGNDAEIEFDFREYPRGTFDIFELKIYGDIELAQIDNLTEKIEYKDS